MKRAGKFTETAQTARLTLCIPKKSGFHQNHNPERAKTAWKMKFCVATHDALEDKFFTWVCHAWENIPVEDPTVRK